MIVRNDFQDFFFCWKHCMKSVHVRSFFRPYFPVFGLNTEIYGVSLRIQSECGKIRTRKTPTTNTFHAVKSFSDFYLIIVSASYKLTSSFSITFRYCSLNQSNKRSPNI